MRSRVSCPARTPTPSVTNASDSLTVDVASARYLLAMKLFSSRVENDADDIMFLYRQLGFTTVEEGLALLESAYRGRPIAVKVKFLLGEIVEALREQDSPARTSGEGQP